VENGFLVSNGDVCAGNNGIVIKLVPVEN